MDPKIFKPYFKVKTTYKGGKTLKDVDPNKTYYKLSSNENLLGSSPMAVKAIIDNLEVLNQYPDRTDVRLREALYEYHERQIPKDQFIAASSGSEVLELFIRGFLGEGKEAIISSPFFLPYTMFSKWQGAIVHDVPLDPEDYSLNTKGILDKVNENTRIIFLTSPNNPTGSYIPKSEIEYLLDNLPDHVIVIMDEVYRHFADSPDYCTAEEFVKAGRPVVAINSFSKAYGLAGLRIGYAYTTAELADYIRLICKPFIINILSLEAAIAALKDKEFIEDTRKMIKEGKEYLYPILDECGIKYWPSQGNFFLTKPDVTDTEFESLMFNEGVMVRPVTSFGAPGCVRITIGTAEANEALAKALLKIYKK